MLNADKECDRGAMLLMVPHRTAYAGGGRKITLGRQIVWTTAFGTLLPFIAGSLNVGSRQEPTLANVLGRHRRMARLAQSTDGLLYASKSEMTTI